MRDACNIQNSNRRLFYDSSRMRRHVYVAHYPGVDGPYRSSRPHGFWPLVIHFPGESAVLGRKLSDRMSESFHRLGREEKQSFSGVRASSFPAERGGHVRLEKLCFS